MTDQATGVARRQGAVVVAAPLEADGHHGRSRARGRRRCAGVLAGSRGLGLVVDDARAR